MPIDNIWQLPSESDSEIFDLLCQTKQVRIERIVSVGHTTPADEWYDQDQHEWVVVLQGTATLLLDDHAQGEVLTLVAGQHLYLPPHRLHRVIATSTEPPCIWLAVHVWE